jgi:hypothetical protein
MHGHGDCPHGHTEGLTSNGDDGEVLAYVCAYHMVAEGCGCGESLLWRLRLRTPVWIRGV